MKEEDPSFAVIRRNLMEMRHACPFIKRVMLGVDTSSKSGM
jgi:hypothetical protein